MKGFVREYKNENDGTANRKGCIMKKLLAVFSLCLCLLMGCSVGGLPKSEVSDGQKQEFDLQADSVSGTVSVNAALEEYLSQNSKYIEQTCTEWENGQIAFKDDYHFDTLYKVLQDGTRIEILNKVSNWTPFSEHEILVIYDGYYLVKIDTQEWTTQTIYESEHLMTAINTNGTLVYLITENSIYRLFLPTNTVDLIVKDEMFHFLLAPFSTTDIAWASYNPVWLKKYYVLGGDENIYNAVQTNYFFCDLKTGKTVQWVPESFGQDYSLEGLEWYLQQKK